MEELLRELIAQNAHLVSVVTQMAEKLDALDGINSTLESIDEKLDSVELGLVEVKHAIEMGVLDVKHAIEMGILDVKHTSESIAHELEWHTDLTFANQVIKAIEQLRSNL